MQILRTETKLCSFYEKLCIYFRNLLYTLPYTIPINMTIHSYSVLTSTAIININISLENWNGGGVYEIWNNGEGIWMKFPKDIPAGASGSFCPNIGPKTAYLEVYRTIFFKILHDDRVS